MNCGDLGGTVTGKNRDVDRNCLPPVRNLPKRHKMPHRSLGNRFAGRISALWDAHDMLQAHKTVVVAGVGMVGGTAGIGKTRLAIEYVHRFGADYPGGVFWINAEQGLSELIIQVTQGADIKIDDTLEEDRQLAQMWRKLSGCGPVLIVLDNFPECESLQPWLPSTRLVHTLVTTRRRDLGLSRLSLDFMAVDEALELLNSAESEFGPEAIKLIDRLGGFPLALELAGNILNRRPALTIEGLLQEMNKAGESQTLSIFAEKYADELPSGHGNDAAATFKISWDLASSTAKAVLQILSCFGPMPVPRRLLREIIDSPCEGVIEDLSDVAFGELASELSLVELDQDNDPRVHRILSAFVREATDAPENLSETVCEAVVQEMARVADECDILAYRQLEKILPHAEMLLSSEAIKTEQAADLANYLCMYYWKRGKFRVAEKHGRKAVDISQGHFQSGHPKIATSQSNLGEVLRNTGALKEARDLLQKALESDEKSFEPGHPVIAVRQSILALVLWDLGESETARDLLYKALESDEKSFESGHPKIAIRQSNLAMVLLDLGELEEAREIAGKAYRSFLNKFGPGHPFTKTAKRNWEALNGS